MTEIPLSRDFQDHNDLQDSLSDKNIVPAEAHVEDENNIKTISSSRKRKRLEPLHGKDRAEDGPSAKKIIQMPEFELNSEGFAKWPIELQAYIFSFLDQKNFHRASLVCQDWRRVARMSAGERSLDLSKRKLDAKDCYALLKVLFSSLDLAKLSVGGSRSSHSLPIY